MNSGLAASVVEQVFRHANAMPNKLCLADGQAALTYGQVQKNVSARAQWLEHLGATKDCYALIECDQSIQFILWMLAAHLVGAIAVPLEKNAAPNRIQEIIEETDPLIYVGKGSFSPCLSINYVTLDFVPDTDGVETPGIKNMPFPNADDVAEILFSTGTTGKSKGIVISHRNNMAIAENVIFGVEMKPDNVELIPMPLSHSHGLRRTYANLVNGSSVIVADGVIALKALFNLLEQYCATSIDLSPSMLTIIFKLSKDRLGDYADKLDYIQLGSSPLAEEDKLHLRTLLPNTRLYNFYGSTEAGCSCVLEFGKGGERPHCIGLPTRNAHFIVVDDNRIPIDSSPDNMGLLASSGEINTPGYFKAPELTEETVKDGFVYTKDLGYIDDEGYVYMLGRKDDVINFGGVKISPEEIEHEVGKYPLVADCACVPVLDDISGQIPVLCIVLTEGVAYDEKELKTFLARMLDSNKRPQRIVVVDEIPRTYNGKIRRGELITSLTCR